jgi:hypothetical protein
MVSSFAPRFKFEAEVMAELSTIDLLGTLVAAILTVMVLSYLLKDNLLFRFAVYLFIGVASGYAGSIAWHNVLQPGLIEPFISRGLAGILDPSSIATLIVPWLLVIILLLKLSPLTSRYGSLPLALMVGVGAAVVVGGAITGTLIPQSRAAMDSLNPAEIAPLTGETGFERVINVLIMLVGTISTLSYFRFSARRAPSGQVDLSPLMEWVSIVGRLFIAVTFGVMYAGALAATIVILAERLQFLWNAVSLLISGS